MNMIFAIWKVGQPQTYKGITIDNIVIPTTGDLVKDIETLGVVVTQLPDNSGILDRVSRLKGPLPEKHISY
ncbi:hypothetical protein F4694_003811 [Bacillus niacini]|uniref:Uncharacterized protein n=1 Tax=Neobacillus niacini TaxID=86668 RepID=A0A852TH28_9BACI|nr:hypothetical protein [Neobacillus niacini]